ncbi:hypothetical protein EJB05_06523, partial [Eragrostis curvula]
MINLVSSAFFSVDMVDLEDAAESSGLHGLREHAEGLADLMTKPNVSDFFPLLRRLDLQGRRRMMGRHLAAMFSIVDGILDRRLDEPGASSNAEQHDDFLQVLLNLMSKGQIDRDVAKAMVFEVRAEIDGVLGGKKTVDETDAMSLPYLMAVVKEALRLHLHPVAPVLVPHLAVEDGVEIGGFAVPKGSSVFFNVWAIMRDPAAWDRPDEFVPERVPGHGGGLQGKDFEFIHFGSGRRQCPGLPMAERVVLHLLASLLHAFEWRLPDGMSAEQLDSSERFTTSNVLAVPLKAVPTVIT